MEIFAAQSSFVSNASASEAELGDDIEDLLAFLRTGEDMYCFDKAQDGVIDSPAPKRQKMEDHSAYADLVEPVWDEDVDPIYQEQPVAPVEVAEPAAPANEDPLVVEDSEIAEAAEPAAAIEAPEPAAAAAAAAAATARAEREDQIWGALGRSVGNCHQMTLFLLIHRTLSFFSHDWAIFLSPQGKCTRNLDLFTSRMQGVAGVGGLGGSVTDLTSLPGYRMERGAKVIVANYGFFLAWQQGWTE